MSDTLERRRTLVGIVIREARESLPLTQAALAAKLRISQGALCDWEKGRRSPAIAELPDVARALDLTPLTLAKRILDKIANRDCQ